jgi:hypothetical protein
VIFSAPPPSSSNSSDPSSAAEKEYYEDAAGIPGSPIHADLQYLHRSLQKVHFCVTFLRILQSTFCTRRVVVSWI